ncbi:uroporphyrinogen-III synthase [uncultured Rhodoblastus sp.]|uniref:uroporphyrinogen-III synthase n=1 Tax=uncultured Rhodoblastus sp. TaxID=543037 RepID=UPI0025D2B344|nr:uroporphyrinogen-III synthase [uncultured Rhodoblastus sp.]
MRVLVTRPPEQAAPTAQKLVALGHVPVLAPVLEIVATGARLPAGPFDLLLASSAQAFLGIAPESAPGSPLACVGAKTAEAARRRGFEVQTVGADSEALATVLLAEGRPKSALYLAGRERKGLLERRLRENSWRVEIIETYEARPVPYWPENLRAALACGEIDAILHYSPRSAALALALMGREAAPRLRHFCLSAEIAALCGAWAPQQQIVAAFQPDEESLMALLRPVEARPRP